MERTPATVPLSLPSVVPSHLHKGSSHCGFGESNVLLQRLLYSADPRPTQRGRKLTTPGENTVRYLYADLDTPYPRLGQGGMSTGYTRYGPDKQAINGNGWFGTDGGYAEKSLIDGRMGAGHRRMREGRV